MGLILGSLSDSGRLIRGTRISVAAAALQPVRADVSKAFNSRRIRNFQSTIASNRDIKNDMPGIDWPLVWEK
jgi:hypothetical protein